MAKIEDLKNGRKGARISFTILLNKVNAEILKPDPSKDTVNSLYSLLKAAYEKLVTAHDGVTNLGISQYSADEDNLKKFVDIQTKYIEEIIDSYVTVGAAVLKLTKEPTTHDQKTPYKVKLPNLTIKPFHGSPTDYPEFIDAFNASIGSREDLDDTSKLQYLCQFLRGAAQQSVSGFESKGENLNPVLQVLEKTFGNPRAVATSIAKNLMAYSAIKSESDPESIRKLAFYASSKLRWLEIRGIVTDSSSWILVPILESKLPSQTLAQWEHYLHSKGLTTDPHKTTVSFFLDWIITYASALGASSFHTGNVKTKQSGENKNKKSAPDATLALVAQQSPKSPTKKGKGKGKGKEAKALPPCIFCASQSHLWYRCPTAREWTHQKKMKCVGDLCPNCIKDHAKGACQNPHRCTIGDCNGSHANILHRST